AAWLGDLGMTAAARLARQLQHALDDPAHLEQSDLTAAVRAAGLVEDLLSSVDTTGVGAGLSATSDDRLLVIGEPGQAVDSLIWYSVTRGFTVQHAGQLANWPDSANAISIVADPQQSLSALLLSSRSAAERYPGVPLVVLSGAIDPPDRIELAIHATALMDLSARPAEVLDEMRRHIHIDRHGAQIAVRGEANEEFASELRELNFDAWAAANDREVLSGLESGRASAVVLMASDDNSRFMRLLRAQPTTRRCVVVELADDPAEPKAQSTADLRVESSEPLDSWSGDLRCLLRLRADVDPDLALNSRTGGVPWTSAKFLAERLLLGVHRDDSVASLCVVQYDETDSVAEIDAAQDLLMREFRTDDIVTRSADRETILVLGGVDRHVVGARLELITRRLPAVGTRVGIAEFPYDAQSVADLVIEARSTLTRSREADGPRVATADWRPGGIVTHDVILADSDPAVACVVGEALQRCGLTVDHVPDGQLLLDRLADPQVRLPKLLILEFDLEGIDGLTILRRLQPQAALRRFDVVMLSARTRETDLQQAYDLGVTEVITKPFSPGILLRRLRRIMAVAE
ncbi:MAG: response regulator, partial [Acidimicrobiales bacterium]